MKSLLFAALALAASAAFAGSAADELANRTAFDGTLSRQSVQQEYLDARRDGTLPLTGEAASLTQPVVAFDAARRLDVHREAHQAARQRVVHERM